MNAKFIVIAGTRPLGLRTFDEMIRQVRVTGQKVVITREPGGTPLAENIRTMLNNRMADGDSGVIRKLIAAARIHHEHNVIKPALAREEHVICDSTGYTWLDTFSLSHEGSLIHEGFTREYLRGKPTMLVVLVSKSDNDHLKMIFRNLEETINTGFTPWETTVLYVDPKDPPALEQMLVAMKDHVTLQTA